MRAKRRSSAVEQKKMLRLAAWYREFAERAGSSVIWESRLLMAEALEKEAALLEQDCARNKKRGSPHRTVQLGMRRQ